VILVGMLFGFLGMGESVQMGGLKFSKGTTATRQCLGGRIIEIENTIANLFQQGFLVGNEKGHGIEGIPQALDLLDKLCGSIIGGSKRKEDSSTIKHCKEFHTCCRMLLVDASSDGGASGLLSLSARTLRQMVGAAAVRGY
jgi:hypothetical protein